MRYAEIRGELIYEYEADTAEEVSLLYMHLHHSRIQANVQTPHTPGPAPYRNGQQVHPDESEEQAPQVAPGGKGAGVRATRRREREHEAMDPRIDGLCISSRGSAGSSANSSEQQAIERHEQRELERTYRDWWTAVNTLTRFGRANGVYTFIGEDPADPSAWAIAIGTHLFKCGGPLLLSVELSINRYVEEIQKRD